MSEVTYYIKIFIALIVLVNPIEGIPLFLNNTNNLSRDQKILIAKKTSIAVFIILFVSLFAGRYVLELFGISIGSFSFAGGIIIFLIAVNMVIGKSSDSGEKSLPGQPPKNQEDISVVPLATPLLAGPGAISSMIVYGSKSTGIIEDVLLCVIVISVSTGVWLSLKAATRMERTLHETGVKVLTKISGLLVAAIAVELIFAGLKQMLPSLAK